LFAQEQGFIVAVLACFLNTAQLYLFDKRRESHANIQQMLIVKEKLTKRNINVFKTINM